MFMFHATKRLASRRLATCMALALGFPTVGPLSASMPAPAIGPHLPSAQTRAVLNCNDSGAESLRDILTNPNSPHHAASGDFIDLSQLPCSLITLTTGEIVVSQSNLTLLGPSSGQTTVTISGGSAHRIFNVSAGGTLSIEDLTIADGYFSGPGDVYGGCIVAFVSSLYLRRTTVTGCTIASSGGHALGGAMAVGGDVTLVLSSVIGNKAKAPAKQGFGGGIFTGSNIFSNYSSISGNVAENGIGGGAYSHGSMSFIGTTIDHNESSHGGGLRVSGETTILNSTISGNTGHADSAAVYVSGTKFSLLNSTVAFNQSDAGGSEGAIYLSSIAGDATLHSSIVAKNTAGNMPNDFTVGQGWTLQGADNLVMASNIATAGVVTSMEDPRLGPLAFNGGFALTHALLPGSPAIGAGNHLGMPDGFTNDQRGPGYPRSTGAGLNETTDIGAFEFDSIFSGSLDF